MEAVPFEKDYHQVLRLQPLPILLNPSQTLMNAFRPVVSIHLHLFFRSVTRQDKHQLPEVWKQ